MDNSPVKNPFDDITPEEVYEEAVSLGALERIFEDFKSCVKNSNSYKSLMEATKENIFGDYCVPVAIKDVQSKQKRLKEVAALASQFDCSVSEFFSATIDVEGKPVIEKIIKQLSFSKGENASIVDSLSKKGPSSANIKSYDQRQPGTSGNVCNGGEDDVSSVHTSELSSSSDEVSSPNPDTNGKKPKISFKSIRKSYKSMVEETKKTPIKRRRKPTSKTQASIGSRDSGERDALPKRKRKPNSRYISK